MPSLCLVVFLPALLSSVCPIINRAILLSVPLLCYLSASPFILLSVCLLLYLIFLSARVSRYFSSCFFIQRLFEEQHGLISKTYSHSANQVATNRTYHLRAKGIKTPITNQLWLHRMQTSNFSFQKIATAMKSKLFPTIF